MLRPPFISSKFSRLWANKISISSAIKIIGRMKHPNGAEVAASALKDARLVCGMISNRQCPFFMSLFSLA